MRLENIPIIYTWVIYNCMSLLEFTVRDHYGKRMSRLVPIHLRNKAREHNSTNNGTIVYSMLLVSTVMYISCTVLLENADATSMSYLENRVICLKKCFDDTEI